MTPEELAALQAKAAQAEALATQLAEVQEKIAIARRIEKGYLRLKELQPDAARYLDGWAKGEDPEPFWAATTTNALPDLGDPTAREPETGFNPASFKGEILKHLDQQLAAMTKTMEQRFNAVAKPVLALHRDRAEDLVKAWATQKFPGFDWAAFRAKATELAGPRTDLLEDEAGLQTLAKAWWAEHAEKAGYQRAQQEQQARTQLASSLLTPSFASGDRDVEGDLFTGVDKTDMAAMFQRMIDRDLARQSGADGR